MNSSFLRFSAASALAGLLLITPVFARNAGKIARDLNTTSGDVDVIVQFRSGEEALPEFERLLKLDEELLRYLVVQHHGEPTAPMSIMTREPRRDDEDGEEGDDDL